MAVTPALAAITVFPAALQAQIGIPGKVTGLLISDFSPNNTANVEMIRDEDTNPAVMIISEQQFSISITGRVMNRAADVGNAHVGSKLDISAMPLFVAGTSRGFPLTTSGDYEAGHFVLTDRGGNTVSPTTLDQYSATYTYWNFKLPRHPAP